MLTLHLAEDKNNKLMSSAGMEATDAELDKFMEDENSEVDDISTDDVGFS